MDDDEYRLKRFLIAIAASAPWLAIVGFLLGHNALDKEVPEIGRALWMFIPAAVAGLALPLLLVWSDKDTGTRALGFIGAVPLGIFLFLAAMNYATWEHCDGSVERAELLMPTMILVVVAQIVLSILPLTMGREKIEQAMTIAFVSAFVIGTGAGVAALGHAASIDFQAETAEQDWSDWYVHEKDKNCAPVGAWLMPLAVLVAFAFALRRKR